MPHATFARLGALVVTITCLLAACTGASTRPPAVGFDPEQADAALAEYAGLVADVDQVRAIVVAQGDEIVYERYFGSTADRHWGVQSVTKSVVSMLIGIAIEEGLTGPLDAPLGELLPDDAGAMSPEVAGTTLRHLLTMTAGLPSGAQAPAPSFTATDHWVRDILRHPESPPGSGFVYSNGTSHLLTAILQRATGTTALEYARTRLFTPLGIDTTPAMDGVIASEEALQAFENAGFAWPTDPQGVNTGWWGLKLLPRDLLKLGQLYLAGGRWGGEQLVAESWVKESTSWQVPADGSADGIDGYGYQWWVGTVDGDVGFLAMGFGGQLIWVVPPRDLVVVASTEVRFDDATSRGVDLGVLVSILEDVVVSQFEQS